MTSNINYSVTDKFVSMSVSEPFIHHHAMAPPKRSSQQSSPHSTSHAYFPPQQPPPPSNTNSADSGRGLPTTLFNASAQPSPPSAFQPTQDRSSYATNYPQYVSHDAAYNATASQHYQHSYQQRQIPVPVHQLSESYQSRPPQHPTQPLDIAHNGRSASTRQPDYNHSPPSPRSKTFFVLPPPSSLAAGVPHLSHPHGQERHGNHDPQGFLPAFGQQHSSISLPPLGLSDHSQQPRPMMSEPVYSKAPYDQRQPQSAPQPLIDPSRAMRNDASRASYAMQAPQQPVAYHQGQGDSKSHASYDSQQHFSAKPRREHHHSRRVSHGEEDLINSAHISSNQIKREREPDSPKIHQGNEHAPSRKRSRGSNVQPPSSRTKKITPPPNVHGTSPPQTPPTTTTSLKYETEHSRKPSLRVDPTLSLQSRQVDKTTPSSPHSQAHTHTQDHAHALASLARYDPANNGSHTLAALSASSVNYTTTPPATPSVAPSLSRRRSSSSSESSTSSSSDPSSASSMSSTGQQHMYTCEECGKACKHVTKHKCEHSINWTEGGLNKQMMEAYQAAQILIEIASMRVNMVN